MNAWIRIEINRTQLAGGADLKLEAAILSVHEANDQPLFWLGLFEKIPRPANGSRVYYLTPGSEVYLCKDLTEFQCRRTRRPKTSEVRPAGATLPSLFLLA